MIPWTHIEIGEIRLQELRRAADHHRMVRALRASTAPHDPAYCRALAWIGRQFVTWGARLERRYSRAQDHRAHPAEARSAPRATQEWDCC